MKTLALLLALAIPLVAQSSAWVDPVTSVSRVAKNPAAWNNKPVAIEGARFPKFTSLPDGNFSAWFGKEPDRIEVILHPPAMKYYKDRVAIHKPDIYQGEVRMNPATGKLRLTLYRGLTFAPHRPVANMPPAPPLRDTP